MRGLGAPALCLCLGLPLSSWPEPWGRRDPEGNGRASEVSQLFGGCGEKGEDVTHNLTLENSGVGGERRPNRGCVCAAGIEAVADGEVSSVAAAASQERPGTHAGGLERSRSFSGPWHLPLVGRHARLELMCAT